MILPEIKIEEDVFEVKINFEDLDVDLNKVELDLGYIDVQIPDYFKQMLVEIASKLPQICFIHAGYRLLGIEKPIDRKDGILLNNIFFRTEKIVTNQLKNSTKAIIFTCTIGNGMETWAKKMIMEGNPILGYLIDSVASLTAETATNLLHEHIGSKMQKDDLNITNRYSPGYCNWSVAEQKLLFSLLPENFCGIRLTESSLMIPIKSVSGVIGAGKKVKRNEYLCDKCGVKNCTYRSKRPAHLNKN
jgi:hypothetical protein